MKVNIKYTDNYSLTPEEIIENNKSMFGQDAEVIIEPNDENPESFIYYGIQQLITEKQVHLFYDEGEYLYDEKINSLRLEILQRVEDILNRVIIDNESRIS